MCSLFGLRPPQFSEGAEECISMRRFAPSSRSNGVVDIICYFLQDDAWLPTWLQEYNAEQINMDSMDMEEVTFEHRVKELQLFQNGISCEERFSGEDRCNIGQLFISGSESSANSFTRSTERVVQFHLRLSSDSDFQDTILTNDECTSESNSPFSIQPLENSRTLRRENIDSSVLPDVGATNFAAKLERSINESGLFPHDENEHFSEAGGVVELCVAASEALAINQVIESDSFSNLSAASAILEASLRVKQARSERLKDTFCGSSILTSEADHLSDLDDKTMESAYEDVGVHFTESPANELSVSQVKDTFESGYDRHSKHKLIHDPTISPSKLLDDSYTRRKEGFQENGILMKQKAEILASDQQELMLGRHISDLNADFGCHYDSLMSLDTQAKVDLSVPAEKANLSVEANNSPEIKVISSPIMNHLNNEKDSSTAEIDQERFQSRWLGGWARKNEGQCTTMKYSIRGPYAGETSFLSESEDTALDKKSNMQKHGRQSVVASQLSIHNDNGYDPVKYRMILSQDGRSSTTSLVDPFCSVVPCSIADSRYSSLAVKHEDSVPLEHNVTTLKNRKEKVRGTSPARNVHAQKNPGVNIMDSRNGVSRRLTSLGYYCNSSHAEFFEKNTQQKKSLLVSYESKFSCMEIPHTTWKEAVSLAAENFPVSSHVHILEKDTDLPENKKHSKPEMLSKNCYSTRGAEKLAGSCQNLEPIAQKMDRFLKNWLGKDNRRLIFQDMEFLLTGFSQQKEREIDGLIWKYGGMVLSQIPSTYLDGKRKNGFKSRALPVVLCLKKIQSFKFFYGCALNAYVLKFNWLIDSIAAGFVLPPNRYMVLSRKISRRCDQVYAALYYNHHSLLFNSVGVMLHGKAKYLTNVGAVIKHGGGQVFRTLQRLVQALEVGRILMAVVVADESCVSRHLKHCILENNIPITSIYWIIRSLYVGRLLPLESKKNSRRLPTIKLQKHQDLMELSQYI